MNIHQTAIVSEKAKIHESTRVGQFVTIDEGVSIGENCEIFPNVHITGNTIIGKNNKIFNGAVIGHDPQDITFDKSKKTGILIGDDNIIREYVTIHRATKDKDFTRIGNKNFIMIGTHIAHDCVIEDETTIVNSVSLGGHVHIEKKAFISGHVGIHQFCRIGAHSMIGSCEKISRDVVPFMTINDFPARTTGPNTIGLKRAEFDEKRRMNIQRAYKKIFREKKSIKTIIMELEENFKDDADIKYIINFIKNSVQKGRGIIK